MTRVLVEQDDPVALILERLLAERGFRAPLPALRAVVLMGMPRDA